MVKSRIALFSLIVFAITLLTACDTEDPFSIPPPDFTTVPEPYDTSNAESVNLREGVTAYIHEEGYGPFSVSPRDQVLVFMSLRTDEGKIIYSTFSSGRTNPVSVNMSVVGDIQQIFDYTILMTYTPGLKIGLLGMKEGERRTIVVPPEQAFQDLPESHPNYQYRDNTLFYDIRISSLSPKKSQ